MSIVDELIDNLIDKVRDLVHGEYSNFPEAKELRYLAKEEAKAKRALREYIKDLKDDQGRES